MSEPYDDGDEAGGAPGLPPFLTDPWGVLRRRWRWMLAAALLVGAASAAVVTLRPVTYEASARLMMSRPRVPEDFVRSISIESMGEQVSAIVSEILSNDSLAELVEKTRFAERANVQGSREDVLGAARSAITVEPDQELRASGSSGPDTTYVFVVRFRSKDPKLAADMANGLVSRFTSAHARRQTRQARLTTQFLEREAQRARKELEAIRKKIAQFKREHRGQLPSELSTKLSRLTRLQQQRDSLGRQLSQAESRLVAVREQGVGDQRTKVLADLRSQLVNELTVHTQDHPNVKALERQIAQIEKDLEENPPSDDRDASPAAKGVRREIASLRSQIQAVEGEIATLEAQVGDIPALQEELDALEQQESLLQEKYVEASRKVRDANLAENLQREQQGFSVSVLEPAFPPSQPTMPSYLFALMGLAATLGAGAGTGLLLELLDPVILTARQVEDYTGLPTLGTVPRIR